MVAVFQSCFLEQFPYLWNRRLWGLDSSACALNTTGDCIFQLGVGLGSCSRQHLVRCFSVAGAPACLQWPLWVSIRSCGHWHHSSFVFFRVRLLAVPLWIFHSVQETVCWLSWGSPFQETSQGRLKASPLARIVGKILLSFSVRGKFFGLFLLSSFHSYSYVRNLYSLKQISFLKGRASLESMVLVQDRCCKLKCL